MQVLNANDHKTIALDLASRLPDAKDYFPNIVNQTAPTFLREAERASDDLLRKALDRLGPQRDTLNAYDLIRLIVLHETMASRGI